MSAAHLQQVHRAIR